MNINLNLTLTLSKLLCLSETPKWIIRWGSKLGIVLSLKWLNGQQKSNFLVMDRFVSFYFFCLGNSVGNSKSVIYFTSNDSLDHKKFVIMIRCKINFDMIWYSVWLSNLMNFVFMNVVILVFICFLLLDF